MALSDTEQTNKAQARRGAEQKIRRKLHHWFERHGRDLPWRRTRDPYAIMVSEFMLQQTSVATVIPYFERWLARFPTLESLAQAADEEVLALWQGLGYYGRARNLRRAAITIVEKGAGKIPRSVAELRLLPGVGDYTAAAVVSFAFDAVQPVVDANIARLLARLWNWKEPIDDTAGRAFLQNVARDLLPKSGGRLHNSALMELGALICVARNPQCSRCPIRRECAAEKPDQLPIRKPRPSIEQVSEARAFIFERGKLWLEPAPGPRWRGMWLLPPASRAKRRPDHTEPYSITRFRVTMRVFVEPGRGRDLVGYAPDRLPPMPSPHRRAVAAMLERVHTRA
jgi:A/G-specific adenine glycosylase